MREFRGVSVRKLAGEMGISHASVHQFETGRADFTQVYLEKFLKALGYSIEEWEMFLSNDEDIEGLKAKCFEILNSASPSRIKEIYRILR